MNKKTVIILGAGLMQKKAILAAKNLGFYTVVLDANPNAECIQFADEFKKIDLKDREAIFLYADSIRDKLATIFTAGTDFSTSVSYAAERLGLNAHSFEAALNASIKTRMRECFKNNNVPSPSFFKISEDELSEQRIKFILDVLGYPCVVKPIDNMGARGCRMIRNFSEAMYSVKNAIDNSKTKTAILEEYMQGNEFSIDALIYNNSMTITGFADRHVYYEPYFVETGHTMPSTIDDEKKYELIDSFANAVYALNLSIGAAKADIKYTKKGPMIGEIAARLSGGYMSGWTYPYSSDLNLTEEALKIALGQEPSELISKRKELNIKNKFFKLYEVPSIRTSAERAWISIPGIIKSIEGLDSAKKVKFVNDVYPRPVKVGDEIDFPRNNVEKCGNVISQAVDYSDAVEASEKACSKVIIRLQPNNKMTDAFLESKQFSFENDFPPPAYKEYKEIENYNLEGVIPKNSPVLSCIDADFIKLLKNTSKSWNYLTAFECAERFDLLVPIHDEINKKKFWSGLLKGALQGAIYISDSK